MRIRLRFCEISFWTSVTVDAQMKHFQKCFHSVLIVTRIFVKPSVDSTTKIGLLLQCYDQPMPKITKNINWLSSFDSNFFYFIILFCACNINRIPLFIFDYGKIIIFFVYPQQQLIFSINRLLVYT